jgi:hypothetical protein
MLLGSHGLPVKQSVRPGTSRRLSEWFYQRFMLCALFVCIYALIGFFLGAFLLLRHKSMPLSLAFKHLRLISTQLLYQLCDLSMRQMT